MLKTLESKKKEELQTIYKEKVRDEVGYIKNTWL